MNQLKQQLPQKNTFPISWYPLCLSSELARGEIKCVTAFHQTWVLFRTVSGNPGLISRHCPHMGTDLSNGKISGEELICPFHHFKYSTSGVCKVTFGQDKTLGTQKFTCYETSGIIFVFPISTVSLKDFPFPPCPKIVTKGYTGMVVTKTLNTPYQALIFNGFDTHHLECIHHRSITQQPELSTPSPFQFRGIFKMRVKKVTFYDHLVSILGSTEQEFELNCWGGNHLTISNIRTRDDIVITSVPLNRNESRIFIYATSEQPQLLLNLLVAQVRLSLTAWLGQKFLEPDIKIVENMRPDIRSLIPTIDSPVAAFWSYWDQLPKFDSEQLSQC